MIARLKGKILEKEPTAIVLDCQGLGLKVNVSLNTSEKLGKIGDLAELLTLLYIQRDEFEIYGFADEEERRIFKLLTGVSGIGPKAAINILSRFTSEEVKRVIAEKDVENLRRVPGVGIKKAETIIFNLKNAFLKPAETKTNLIREEALAALISLGLTKKEAVARLNKIKLEGLTVEEVVRAALKQQ